jgi:hypothetical protein
MSGYGGRAAFRGAVLTVPGCGIRLFGGWRTDLAVTGHLVPFGGRLLAFLKWAGSLACVLAVGDNRRMRADDRRAEGFHGAFSAGVRRRHK